MSHPVDVHVGQRIRQRRWALGITQQELAEAVGIKFQQIQKYETGVNRVSASRLWDIGRTLSVSVSYFFEGIEGAPVETENRIHDREAIALLRSIDAIPDPQRRKLVDLARALSAG